MAIEQMCGKRKGLLVGAVLGLACGTTAGCGGMDRAIIQPSIRAEDAEMDVDFHLMRSRLSPEDRAVLDNELMWRKKRLVHVIQRDGLPKKDSRGGASNVASSKFSKERCKHHPDVDDVPSTQDWDLRDPRI